MKGVIIYKGKYGATRQYAEWLGEALQIPVYDPGLVSARMLAEYDFVVAGASVYAGRLLNRRWLKRNRNLLKAKKLFLFIVCASTIAEKEKLNDIILTNIPVDLIRLSDTYFLPGRLVQSKLSFIDRLILNMGANLQKDPSKKKAMLRDFDSVNKENIKLLVHAVSLHIQQLSGTASTIPYATEH